MKWITENDLKIFFSKRNYDLRMSRNGRWIDQKCTPDVITIVADCIINYIRDHGNLCFSSMDIWHDSYTTQNVESIFKKPNPDERKARNEYDKFFQQPMEMLSYSGVLKKKKIGNRNFYKVNDKRILDYIALREKNSLQFLCQYIQKVLDDSGIYKIFSCFFTEQTKDSFISLKNGYANFIINNTPINGTTEVFRIFTKVLNPLAYLFNKHGTEHGHFSNHIITFDMLMYNRDNFRDIYANKPKDVTRKEFASKMGILINSNYARYLSQKAKKFIRLFNEQYRNGLTEVSDIRHNCDQATHIHHIFPESEYPEISFFYENLIALTPTQHLNYAHPNGNTYCISSDYQHVCLIAKTSHIQENLASINQEHIYLFHRFIEVLNTGLNTDSFSTIEDGDYNSLIIAINFAYDNKIQPTERT